MISTPHFTEQEVTVPLNHVESAKQYENKTDQDVWRAFNKGNEAAFNYIYRAYAGLLYQYGTQFSKDEYVLQECIQNIFIGLRRRRGYLSDIQSIKAYLFKSLQREVRRYINQERDSIYSARVLDEHLFPIEVSHETKLIQDEYDAEKKRMIEQAMNQLTVRQRQAILLLYEEGMSYKEIAEVMELNEVKSARKIIYRALASLKNLIHNK